MYFSIHHKINLTLLIVSILVSILIALIIKDNNYGLKTNNKIINIFLTSFIIYTVLYCIAKYNNLYQGLEMYANYKEHMTNGKDESKDESNDKSKDNDDTKEEFLFLSSKRPTMTKHQVDKKVIHSDENDLENEKTELMKKIESDETDTELLRSIKGEIESLRLQMTSNKDLRRKIYENEKEEDMELIQRKIVNTRTPLSFEDGWSILKQPGQWQFPAIFPPKCLAKNDTIPKFGAKPTYDVLGKPYSEYLSSDKFKQL
jgi:hypothetical protein